MQSNRAAESPSGIGVRNVGRLQDCNHVKIVTTSQLQPRQNCNHVTSLVVCHGFGPGGSGLYAEKGHVLECGLEIGISGHRQHIVAPHAQSRWRPTRRSCPASGAPCPDAPRLTSHSAQFNEPLRAPTLLGQRQQRSRRAHPMLGSDLEHATRANAERSSTDTTRPSAAPPTLHAQTMHSRGRFLSSRVIDRTDDFNYGVILQHKSGRLLSKATW